MAAPKSSAPLFLPRSVVASESAAVRIAGRASSIASVTPLERSFSVVGRMARFANRVADGWLGTSGEVRPSGRAQVGAEVGLVVPRPWYLEPKPQAAAVPRRRPMASTVEADEAEAVSTAIEGASEVVEAPSSPMRVVPELPRDLVAAPIAPVRRAEEILELRARDVVPRPALQTVARRPEQIASPLQAALRHAEWVDTQITQRVQAAATAIASVTQRAAERAATVEQSLSYVAPAPAPRPAAARPERSVPASEHVAPSGSIDTTPSTASFAAERRAPVDRVAPVAEGAFAAPVREAPEPQSMVAPVVAVRDGRVVAERALPAAAPSLGFVAAMPAAFAPVSTPVDASVQTMARFIDRLVAPQLAAVATPRTVVLSSDGRPTAIRREQPELSPIVLPSATTQAARGLAAVRREAAAIRREQPELSPIVLPSATTQAARGAAAVRHEAAVVSAGVPEPVVFEPPAAASPVEGASVVAPLAPRAVASTVDVSTGRASDAPTTMWTVDAPYSVAPSARPSLARPGAIAARAEEVAIGQALRVARAWGEPLTVVTPSSMAPGGVVGPADVGTSSVAVSRALATGAGFDRPMVAVAPSRPVVGATPTTTRPARRALEVDASPAAFVAEPAFASTSGAVGAAARAPVGDAGARLQQVVAPLSTTAQAGVAAIGGFIARLLGVQLVQQMAPLPLTAALAPTPVAASAAAARAPLADELTPPPAPVAAPAGRGRAPGVSPGASRSAAASADSMPTAQPVAERAGAFGATAVVPTATPIEGATMLRPGGVGLVAEQLAGRVGVRASSLAIEFVDPPALGQVVAVSRASEARTSDRGMVAPSAPRALAAGGVPIEVRGDVDVVGVDDAGARSPAATASPAAIGAAATIAMGAALSSAAGTPETNATVAIARVSRKANTLSADEWALVSVFPSETTAYQVAAARQARSWRRMEARGVDAVFAPVAEGAVSFASHILPAMASTDAGPIERSSDRAIGSTARATSPPGFSSIIGGIGGEEGSPYVLSSTRAAAPFVAPTDQPRLPDGRLPRGGALWPTSATFEPIFELTLPSLTSAAQKVAEAPSGQPLWNALPPTPIVSGVSEVPAARRGADQDHQEETIEATHIVTSAPSRSSPSEPSGPASRVPSAPLLRTVAPGARGGRPTVRPLSREEREDHDHRPAPGSPEARPALAILKGGAAGGGAARGGGVGASGSSGSFSSSGSSGDGGVAVDGSGVSFRPSSEAAARLLEAVRQPGAIPQDGRVTMADLTLIAIASTTQQVAAAEEGGGPAAAPAAAGGGGGGGAAGGGKAGEGGAGADITAIAEKVYEAYKRLLEIQRERSGDSWES
jgi:hypothetical protein